MPTISPETIKNNCVGKPGSKNNPSVSYTYPVIPEPTDITVIPIPIFNSANPVMSKSNFNLGSLDPSVPQYI